MPEKITAEDLVKNNPNIDLGDLKKMQKLHEQLFKSGTTKAGKRLASPLERRRIKVGEDEKKDPRTVRVRFRS